MASSFVDQVGMNRGSGKLAMLHRLHRQILARCDTIATGINARKTSAELRIDMDFIPLLLQSCRDRIADGIGVQRLAYGFKDRVGGQLKGFTSDDQFSAIHSGLIKAHAAYLAGLIEQDSAWLSPRS